MIWLIVGLSILGAVIIFTFVFAFVAYRMVFYVPANHKENSYDIPKGEQYEREREKMIALIRETDAVPYERVFITSKDGLKLSARYYHYKDGAPLQIQFPGYKGSSIRDFSGGNKLSRENGFNTLLVDMRAHGMSEGRTITFGVKERYDCLCWIDYAIERFGADTPIYLAGVSMGGATVLMAAQFDLPGNVKGIVADCPFTTPSAVVKYVCKFIGYNPKIVYPFISLGARIFGHFSLTAANSAEAVKHTNIPILLLHGEDDRIVPCEMSKEIYDNCSVAKRYTFPGAAHAISYIADPVRYEQIALSFIEECKNK